jgi:hypothetical protein
MEQASQIGAIFIMMRYTCCSKSLPILTILSQPWYRYVCTATNGLQTMLHSIDMGEHVERSDKQLPAAEMCPQKCARIKPLDVDDDQASFSEEPPVQSAHLGRTICMP